MKRVLSFVFALVFALFVIGSNVTVADEVRPTEMSFQYEYTGSPNGLVADSSPLIAYNIVFDDEGHSDQSYDLVMLLNDEEVPASYNAATGDFTYHASELSGENAVEVQLSFNGSTTPYRTWSWSFTVDEHPVDPFVNRDMTLLSDVQQEVLAQLNVYREALHLPKVTEQSDLQQAAQAHANYLVNDSNEGHGEFNSREGFTGESPAQRASYYGYTGYAIGEGITYRKPNGNLGIEDLMDAPYHRLSLINPAYEEVGAGYNAKGDLVVNYGGTSQDSSEEVLVYPYEGQADAKNTWYVAESPNPLRFWGKDRITTGYPISFAYFSNDRDAVLRVNEARLTNRNGEAVPFYKVDPSIDNHGDTHLFLIPKTPLQPGETYTVHVDAYVETAAGMKNVSKTWSFTTEDSIDIRDAYFYKNDNGTNFLSLNWASGQDRNATVKLKRNNDVILELKSDGYQYGSSSELSAGAYTLEIESPLYDETLTLPIELRVNETPRYTGAGDFLIDLPTDEEQTVTYPMDGYRAYGERTVEYDKTWTITFNQAMSEITLTDEAIYVLNEAGETVETSLVLEEDRRVVKVVHPHDGYTPGETYYLFVEDSIKSSSGKRLRQPAMLKFTIN